MVHISSFDLPPSLFHFGHSLQQRRRCGWLSYKLRPRPLYRNETKRRQRRATARKATPTLARSVRLVGINALRGLHRVVDALFHGQRAKGQQQETRRPNGRFHHRVDDFYRRAPLVSVEKGQKRYHGGTKGDDPGVGVAALRGRNLRCCGCWCDAAAVGGGWLWRRR